MNDDDLTKEQIAQAGLERMMQEQAVRAERVRKVNAANRRNGAIAAGLGLVVLLGTLTLGVITGDTNGVGLLSALGVLMIVIGAYYLGKREKA